MRARLPKKFTHRCALTALRARNAHTCMNTRMQTRIRRAPTAQENQINKTVIVNHNGFWVLKKCRKTEISHSLPSQKNFGFWSTSLNVILLAGVQTDWASSSRIVRNSLRTFSTIHRKPTLKPKTWQALSVSWICMVSVKYRMAKGLEIRDMIQTDASLDIHHSGEVGKVRFQFELYNWFCAKS